MTKKTTFKVVNILTYFFTRNAPCVKFYQTQVYLVQSMGPDVSMLTSLHPGSLFECQLVKS